MVRKWINRVAWVGAVTIASAPLMSLSGQTVGINAAVRNIVKVKKDKASAAREAKRGEKVRLGNLFTTGRSSSVQISLLDRSTVTVGPNANLTINRFVFDPKKKSSSVGASVVKGTFRFMSGKSARGGTNSIETPSATIGIRGTMLEGAVGENALTIASLQPGLVMPARVDPETATVIVLRGPGPNAPPSEKRGEITVTAGGSSVVLNLPGQAVFIPYAGATTIRFNLQTPAYEPFDVMLRTAPDSFSYAAQALLLEPVGQGAPGQPAVPGQQTVAGQPGGDPAPPGGAANPGQPVGEARPVGPNRRGPGVWVAAFVGIPIGAALISRSASN